MVGQSNISVGIFEDGGDKDSYLYIFVDLYLYHLILVDSHFNFSLNYLEF